MAGAVTTEYGGVVVHSAGHHGAFPYCNSLVVRGTEATLVIDPSLAFVAGAPPADLVLVSHAHEDHVAGLAGYDSRDDARGGSGSRGAGEVQVLAHESDRAAAGSRVLMAEGQGLAADGLAEAVARLGEKFHIPERREVAGFADGDVFDLGGRSVRVVHLPGHTPGHCGFLVEPDGFLYVADIDLTGFGPYYGDRDSDLDAFEDSMRHCATIEARWYGTAHQKGVLEGAGPFHAELAAFAQVIARREESLLRRLAVPSTLDQIVDGRLVYRPHVEGPHVRAVEQRTAVLHLERLLRDGRVEQVEAGRYRATGNRPAGTPEARRRAH